MNRHALTKRRNELQLRLNETNGYDARWRLQRELNAVDALLTQAEEADEDEAAEMQAFVLAYVRDQRARA